ncbi:breast cancer protein [Xylariaceae sp. FL0016]|nr:breast cancer protein [Xylariaceae sp. FL0016]
MSRLGGWFRSTTPKAGSSPSGSQVDLRAREIALIEDAMTSASLIMNDDIDGAEERLKKGDSTFHSMGMGVCVFMRSILGFEKAIMDEASQRLTQCEKGAWDEMKKAQKEAANGKGNGERIYPPGSEYALVIAEAQLMSAIVAVLHESLTGAIKGFLKLREAFVALDGIMRAEDEYLKKRGLRPNGVTSQPSLSNVQDQETSNDVNLTDDMKDEDADLEFVDADEAHSGAQTPMEYEGHLTKQSDGDRELNGPPAYSKVFPTADPVQQSVVELPAKQRGFEDGPDSDIFTDPIDIFIHSGANMCFGVLLLMISMIPPAFSRLLSIIGFRGNRERGIKMLWQSSRFNNINGAVSGLMLLAYYNGLLGFADILPTDEDVEKGAVVGYPRTRCDALLTKMRARYPDSGLWRFEVARGLANNKNLHGAIEILKTNTSKMRQVAALNSFELALDSMYVQDYPAMRDNFVRCVELNDWSHALYYYIAGCGELENYRNEFHAEKKDDAAIQRHKQKADELLRKAPTVAGKKRFMSRPLPFEEFVSRKIRKWEERSKALNIDLVDAVGPSPTQEMVYLWNGIKKMQTPELQKAAKALSWDRLTAQGDARQKIEAEVDEQAVRGVSHAAIMRKLGQFEQARVVLEEVLILDKLAFKGSNKDDYALPAANYEMAVLAWAEVQKPEMRHSTKEDNTDAANTDETAWKRKKLDDCNSWLDKVAKWEAYVLDARIGMRVQTGMDTIRWYRREHEWAAAS